MTPEENLEYLLDWQLKVANTRAVREWCLFNIAKIDFETIQESFATTELEAEYKTRFEEDNPVLKKSLGLLQVAININFAFQKAFANRHKNKLQYYRDDASQKSIRSVRAVRNSLMLLSKDQLVDDAN